MPLKAIRHRPSCDVRTGRFALFFLIFALLPHRSPALPAPPSSSPAGTAPYATVPPPMPGGNRMWITAYYTVWGVCGLGPERIDWSAVSHIVHQQIEPTTSGRLWQFPRGLHDDDTLYFEHGIGAGCGDIGVQRKLLDLAHAHGVKVLLGLGGAGAGAAALDAITSDPGRTRQYADGVLGYALQRGYDGVDLDWEFVGRGQKDRFALLLRTLRAGLNAWQPPGLLTCAVPVWHPGNGGYDIDLLNAACDQINLMAYDLSTGQSKFTGFNAPVSDPDYILYDGLDINSGVTDWLDAGLDAAKTGLGVPFFGYLWRKNDEPGQFRHSDSVVQIGFGEAVDYYSRGSYHWDSRARVPWLGGSDASGQKFFISYEDTASLRRKVEYAKEKQFGGIMIFELWRGIIPATRDQPLLRAVRDAAWGSPAPDPFASPGRPVAYPRPRLLSPADGARQVSSRPRLSWEETPGARSYHAQVSTDTSFRSGTLVFDNEVRSGGLLKLRRLKPGTTYFWRVRIAEGEPGEGGNWSERRAFTTSAARRNRP